MRINFAGDLYLPTNKAIVDESISQDLREGLLVCNFENVLNNSGEIRDDKSAILSFDENSIREFTQDKDCVFTLGNNHIHDCGSEGINKTKEILEKYQAKGYGVGYSEQVYQPYIIEGDKKIALFVVSDPHPEVMSIESTSQNMGIANMWDPKLYSNIQNIKNSVDYVVIQPHWGREYVQYPDYKLRQLSYSWIEAGADLIIGHHPHMIQGKEIYRGKSIYYSLGNFIFPEFYTKQGFYKSWNRENNRSIYLSVQFDESISIIEKGLEYYPKLNSLSSSNLSIKEFNQRTKPLCYDNISKKRYYGLVQQDLYNQMTNEYSWWSRKKRSIFKKHSEYSPIVYLILRLLNKIIPMRKL